jgi:hypothetical protein
MLVYLSSVHVKNKRPPAGSITPPMASSEKNARPKESQAGPVMPAPIIMPMVRKVSIETKWIFFKYRTTLWPLSN